MKWTEVYNDDKEDEPKQKAWRPIDSVEFVKAWMTSDTVDEVAEKMGLTKTSVQSKANNLRSKGVLLPKKWRPAVDPNSVEELNKLVAKYQKKAQ